VPLRCAALHRLAWSSSTSSEVWLAATRVACTFGISHVDGDGEHNEASRSTDTHEHQRESMPRGATGSRLGVDLSTTRLCLQETEAISILMSLCTLPGNNSEVS
jgi:hypothetical protein